METAGAASADHAEELDLRLIDFSVGFLHGAIRVEATFYVIAIAASSGSRRLQIWWYLSKKSGSSWREEKNPAPAAGALLRRLIKAGTLIAWNLSDTL